MIKRFSAIAIAMVIFCFLTSCRQEEEPSIASKSIKRQFLSIGTAPPGGAFFVVGGALAQVVNENKGDLNWEVTAESTKGTQENIRRLDKKELEFALANAAISYFAYKGEGNWEKPYSIRAIMTLAPNIAMFITRRKSGLKNLDDLKGRRVVIGPAGAGFEYFLRPILAAHGLSLEDFTPLYNTQAGSVDMLADGSADAAFLGGAVPTASITQASASQDIVFLPFTEQAMASLIADFSFFTPATIPANTYRGQSEPFHGLNVGAMHLITSMDQDEERVYRLIKLLYERRSEVEKKHPVGKAIRAENVVGKTGIPFHDGAIRYYKEIGIWPAEQTAPDSGD